MCFIFVRCRTEISADSGKEQVGCIEAVGGRVTSGDVADGVPERCKRFKSW